MRFLFLEYFLNNLIIFFISLSLKILKIPLCPKESRGLITQGNFKLIDFFEILIVFKQKII